MYCYAYLWRDMGTTKCNMKTFMIISVSFRCDQMDITAIYMIAGSFELTFIHLYLNVVMVGINKQNYSLNNACIINLGVDKNHHQWPY